MKKKYPHLPKIIEPKHNNTIVEIREPFDDINCPRGYRKVTRFHCERVIHCPKGWVLEDGKCSLKRVVCPPGTHKKGNKCFTPKGEECNDDDDDEEIRE